MTGLFGQNDQFSSSPFLALLPRKASLARLQGLRASFFARLENVVSQKSADSYDFHSEESKRLIAEENMLREVLTWLEAQQD